jgi:hypothetical protein
MNKGSKGYSEEVEKYRLYVLNQGSINSLTIDYFGLNYYFLDIASSQFYLHEQITEGIFCICI